MISNEDLFAESNCQIGKRETDSRWTFKVSLCVLRGITCRWINFMLLKHSRNQKNTCLMCETSNIYSCETVKNIVILGQPVCKTWLFYHLSTAGAGPLKLSSVPFMFNLSSSPLVLGVVVLQDVRVFLPELLPYNVAVVLLHPPPAAGHSHVRLLLTGELRSFGDSFLLLRVKKRGHD